MGSDLKKANKALDALYLYLESRPDLSAVELMAIKEAISVLEDQVYYLAHEREA